MATALRTKYNLKTDRAMVGKWEIGYQAPEMYTIKCLADLLETSMDYLSGDEVKEPTTPQDDGLWKDICADEKKLMLARWISGLNQEELQRVVKLLDAALLLPKE